MKCVLQQKNLKPLENLQKSRLVLWLEKIHTRNKAEDENRYTEKYINCDLWSEVI